ncbi:DUF5979 domain-containing protein [Frisingicoccus sp.]|uniref:DUF5979 domain-containing protein n=1 Tax=Frisingicoccus sp. TaxID=1918627 RepID=UPI003AB8569F
MKAGKYKKGWICGGLALMMGAALTLSQLEAFAGDRIDTSKDCSLTITMADDISAQYPELMDAEIPVTLYKVADMDSNADYMPLEGFSEIGLADIDSDTTAGDWAAIAEKACQALGRPYGSEEDKTEEPEETPGEDKTEESEETPQAAEPVKSEFTVRLANGPAALEGLECGMYLVYAEETLTENYVYNFTPYLVSLPTSDYTIEGGGTDTWTYDVVMGLKPQQSTRYGELLIEKTLDTVNTSMGGASCVFQVEAVKDGKLVYSNVLSLSFKEPGTKQILIDEIPMGAAVTVTEVYAGAGYTLTSAPSVNVTVVTPETEGYPATAAFTNDYEYPGYGTSVVNHFEHIGEGWEWNPQTDNAGNIGEE